MAAAGDVPAEMFAVVTMGNGGFEKLEYKKVPTPVPGDGEVLIKVLAAGVNNTEINTRLGWYSKTVTTATNAFEEKQAADEEHKEDGGWSAPTPWPLIQGTDCCGVVVKHGPGVASGVAPVGARVMIRPCQKAETESHWMASDFDGAFAQYVKVRGNEAFPVNCAWTDVELGSIPCAYGTAENMLHRAQVGTGQRVLVPGASGGVGSAVVQLAKRRGAWVTGITTAGKAQFVRDSGADEVIGREDIPKLPKESFDVVVDNVGGPSFPEMLRVLKRGGRYTTSGAIAGPMVELDLRTLYLRDLTLIGTTAWDEPVMPNLVSYIERGEIKPRVHKTFALKDIVQAQKELLERAHEGKLVLIPDHSET